MHMPPHLLIIAMSLWLVFPLSAPGAITGSQQDPQRHILFDAEVQRDDAGLLTFESQLDAESAAKFYALRLEGDAPEGGWTVLVNGRLLEQRPLETKTGSWYQISPTLLREGRNTFSIAGPERRVEDGVHIEGFSLENTLEEIHFDRFAGGPISFAQPPTHPDQDLMDVLHVDLDLTLDASSSVFTTAVMTMSAESLDNSLSQCVLDLNDNGGALIVSAVDDGAGSPLVFSHDGAQERLFITLPAAVPSGNTFTVRVFYSGDPRVSSSRGYMRGTHSGDPVLYTHSQPYAARYWWPCKDIPGDKFTLDMHITVPTTLFSGRELYPVCNGSLVSVVDNGGTKTYNWSEAFEIVTQYVSIACSNYQIASGEYTALDTVTKMEVAHAVYPEDFASESQELPRTIEVLEHFATLFGEYPFLSEKYYTAAWNINFGLEHQTNTSMPDNNLNNPPYHRRNVHELAHMWFGCATGVEIMDHLWLSEGWATYCEALWRENQNGIADYHVRMGQFESSSSDSVPIVSSSADTFTWAIIYTKGAWVLHMLRHVVGDTDFFQAVQNYMADPNNLYANTVVTEDFINHFETVVGGDMNWFFDQWLYRTSRPNYEWTWWWHTAGPDAIIELSLNQIQAGGFYEMPIDFEVEFGDTSTATFTVTNNLATQAFSVNVGPGTPVALTFDPENWLLDINSGIMVPAGLMILGAD